MIYDSEYINSRVRAIAAENPAISFYSIGKSVLGREILAAAAGYGESALLITGGIYAADVFTSLLLLKYLEELADSGGNAGKRSVARILLGTRIIIVPAVNPDGIEIALKGEAGAGTRAAAIRSLCLGDYSLWRANARGVDLSRNFDAGFEQLKALEKRAGITGPAQRGFGGESPESEPETRALTELCRNDRIRYAVSLSSGNDDTVYWNYRDRAPEISRKMARAMARESGFFAEEPMGLTSLGSFKDWFIDELERPAFALTMRRVPAEPGSPAFRAAYSRVREMLSFAAII